MGKWIKPFRKKVLLYIFFIIQILNTEEQMNYGHMRSQKNKLRYPDVIALLRSKRDRDINNIVSNSLQRTNRDSLTDNPISKLSNIIKLNIETDWETGISENPTINSEHAIHAKYVQNSTSINNEHHFQPKWREHVVVEREKILPTIQPIHSSLHDVRQSIQTDLEQLNHPNHHSNFPIVTHTSSGIRKNDTSLLKDFLKPTEVNYDSKLVDYITEKLIKSRQNSTLSPDPIDENKYVPTKDLIDNGTERHRIEIPSKTIFNFFAEENKRPINEVDDFSVIDDGDFISEEESDEENLNSIHSMLVHRSIPILSGLIQGTLNKDMDAKNQKFREYVDSLKSNNNQNSSKLNQENLPMVTPSIKMDLEDPDTTEYMNKTVVNEDTHNLMPLILKPNFDSSTITPTNFDSSTITPIVPPVQSNVPVNSNDIAYKRPIFYYSNKTNENRIEFITIDDKNSTKAGVCMDGSPPGYYLRKGFDDQTTKWIIHLHGGAWCYDLQSCMKRRNSILGSTNYSASEDINSFFHGILSKNSKVNPNFYKWNVAVLSYCDGGLFSGNRKRPLTGKGKTFYFQGRSILKSLIEKIKRTSLNDASEVILSGTSAGGLAVVLQGDFIRKFIPKHVKVRALVDAGIFLDQKSIKNDSLVRQQFRALYSLHKPILNKDCIASVPRREKYMCLFPEKVIQYMKIPVFVVNSLYDHWQLSYLEGVSCIFDDRQCDTNQHDRILEFRNHMFTTLRNMTSFRNTTGIFANSCFAHGQVIIDYTWTRININTKSISKSFFDWYSDADLGKNQNKHFLVDCKYPCNGSCAKLMADKCVSNFKAASEKRRKRDAEIC